MGRRIADDEDDDDGYVPRFRRCYFQLAASRTPAEKLAVRPVTSGCRLSGERFARERR